MHNRLFPKKNKFTYGIYYLAIPLSQRHLLPISYNRPGLISFYDRDHGYRDDRPLLQWASDIMKAYDIDQANGEIVLITLPRILGYAFNPVSFWLCHDAGGALRAVICEVNNTFGETHSYLCAHPDQRPLKSDDVLEGQKLFHVSPFLERNGHYRFRFNIKDKSCGIYIDYYNKDNQKQLLTAVTGSFCPFDRKAARKAFWRHPLLTIKVIMLIHWQAVKLLAKGIKYIPKPGQKAARHSRTGNITKN